MSQWSYTDNNKTQKQKGGKLFAKLNEIQRHVHQFPKQTKLHMKFYDIFYHLDKVHSGHSLASHEYSACKTIIL